MSGAVKLHLLHRRRRIIRRVATTRNLTVAFLHLRRETHAVAQLDVALYLQPPVYGQFFLRGDRHIRWKTPLQGRGYSVQRDKIFTDTRIHRAPDCAITYMESNV